MKTYNDDEIKIKCSNNFCQSQIFYKNIKTNKGCPKSMQIIGVKIDSDLNSDIRNLPIPSSCICDAIVF